MTRKLAPWLTCPECGRIDRTDESVVPHRIGTRESMSCPDCAYGKVNAYGRPAATRCRQCCPSGHRTRFQESEG